MTYFLHEEHGAVQAIHPLIFSEAPPFLSGDIIVHMMHGEADAVGKVLEGFFIFDHISLGVSLRVEANIETWHLLLASAIKPPSMRASPPSARFLLLEGWSADCLPLSCLGGEEGKGRAGSGDKFIGSLLCMEEESVGEVGGATWVVFCWGATWGRAPLDDLKPPLIDSSIPEKCPIWASETKWAQLESELNKNG